MMVLMVKLFIYLIIHFDGVRIILDSWSVSVGTNHRVMEENKCFYYNKILERAQCRALLVEYFL